MSTKYTEERASYLDYLKDAKYELFCNPTKPNLVFDYKEVGKNVAIELQDNTNEVIFSSHLFSITVSYKVKFKFFGTPNNVPIDPQLRVTINWNDIKYEKCSLYKDNKLVSVLTASNSNMPDSGGRSEPRCSGLSMDKSGNLWFANSDQKAFLSVIKKDGGYINFDFPTGRGFTRKTVTL